MDVAQLRNSPPALLGPPASIFPGAECGIT